MGRLIFGILILAALILAGYVIYNFVVALFESIKNKASIKVPTGENTIEEINTLVETLQYKLELAEKECAKGIVDAEEKAKALKEALEKAKQLKQKFNKN